MLEECKVLCICSVVLIGLGALCSATSLPEYEYNESIEGWLRLHIVPATYKDAMLRCSIEGSILASPTTDALTQAMTTLMVSRKVTVITGMRSTFVKGNFINMEGTLLSNLSLPWVKGEPNNLNNEEDCLSMTRFSELADVSCSSVHPFFCYKHNPRHAETSDTMCAPAYGYTWEPRTGSCYKFHREALPWQRCAMACIKEFGTLAVINSNVESQVLKELYARNPPTTHIGSDTNYLVHIGFLDWNQRGNWLTVFGDTLAEAGFGTWGPNEPNNVGNIEFCGSMSVNGLLNDSPCFTSSKAFICEITPIQN